MFLLYTCGLHIYNWLIQLAGLLGHSKARRWTKGRKAQSFALAPPTALPDWGAFRKIWIHAASYGEFEMAKPILNKLLQNPDNRIYVSFFSPSGYENIHFEDDRIFKLYLPLDLKKKQKELVNELQPDKVIFIKYEFWFNLLRVLHEAKIPYYFSSIHLIRSHYLWGKTFSPFADLLKKATKLYCHNPESVAIFMEKGFDNLELLGDTRILKAEENKASEVPLLKWAEPKPAIIYGSIIPSEYSMVQQSLIDFPDYNHILAPHDVGPLDLQKLTDALAAQPTYYSSLDVGSVIAARCLVIDTLGDLKYLYRNAAVAYVGAGFEKGPHNIVEPMIYGIPTIIGPNIEKFPLAKYLSNKRLLTVISEQSALNGAIIEALSKTQNFKSSIIFELEQLKGNLEGLIKEIEQ